MRQMANFLFNVSFLWAEEAIFNLQFTISAIAYYQNSGWDDNLKNIDEQQVFLTFSTIHATIFYNFIIKHILSAKTVFVTFYEKMCFNYFYIYIYIYVCHHI